MATGEGSIDIVKINCDEARDILKAVGKQDEVDLARGLASMLPGVELLGLTDGPNR